MVCLKQSTESRESLKHSLNCVECFHAIIVVSRTVPQAAQMTFKLR